MPEIEPDFVSARLTDEQFAAIGRVAVAWAFLEWTMHQGLASLVSSHAETGRYVAATVRRISAIAELIRVAAADRGLSTEVQEQLDALLTSVITLEKERDFVVHWTWWGSYRPGETIKAESRTKTKNRPPEIKKASELRELAEQINDVEASLSLVLHQAGHFGLTHGGVPQPWPGIPRRSCLERCRDLGRRAREWAGRLRSSRP
jgi:hypothetical protein